MSGSRVLVFALATTTTLTSCSWFFVNDYIENGTDRRLTAADCSGSCLIERQCTEVEKPRRQDLRDAETGAKIKFRAYRLSKFYECTKAGTN
jgi:hypothetical protein